MELGQWWEGAHAAQLLAQIWALECGPNGQPRGQVGRLALALEAPWRS